MDILYDNKVELSNGLQIFSKDKFDKNRISLLIIINSGAGNDPAHMKGLSHLLEHLIFKIEGYTEETLAEFCDFNGIEFNASTGHNEINLMFNLLPEKLDLVLKLAKEFLTNNNYTQKDIIDEVRGPIKVEILEESISPDYIFYNYNHNYLYSGTKYFGNILGNLDSLAGIKVSDLDNYKKKYFVAKNMFFYFEGDFRKINLLESARKHFSDLDSGIKFNNDISPVRKSSELVNLNKDIFEDQSMLSFIYNFGEVCDEDVFKLRLLKNILCDGFTSLFMNKLRTKEKLIYSCEIDINYSYEDCFLNLVILNVESCERDRVIKYVSQIVDRIKVELFKEDYFIGKKTHFKFLFEELFDNEYSRVDLLFNNIFNRHVDYNNFSSVLEKITREDMKEFINFVFEKKPTIIIGSCD